MMNKFFAIAGGIGVLGLGALGFQAMQSHAQVPSTTAQSSVASATVKDISSPSDTDNIQNDTGNVDMPDAPVVTDVRPAGDPADSSSTVEQGTHESGENTAADAHEVEDTN
jgi:hypothetical protein